MTKPLLSWRDLEDLRIKAGVSRAEVSRRAGLSESTFTKGIKLNRVPNNASRKAVLDVLRQWGVA